jgi:high frequency lysogenization protein
MADAQAISQDFERTIALAGVFQAAELVHACAHGKHVEERAVRCSVASTLRLEAATVTDVYQDQEGLRIGFARLAAQLDWAGRKQQPEIARYASDLIALERQLIRRTDLIERVQHGVRLASNQVDSCTHDTALNKAPGLLDDAVLGTLAQAYKDTLSHLRPRIMVRGDPELLKHPLRADKIRSLLLAGIRSCVLWRQMGGSRHWMLFKRKQLLRLARSASMGEVGIREG